MTTSPTAGAPASGRRRTPLIGATEARRALYVDYEGSKDHPPTLLGYLVEGTLAAGIVEPLFAPCRERYRAAHATVADHRQLLVDLVDRAEREDRLIVSWSKHDLRLMEAALGGDAEHLTILGRRYRDARLTARRWKNLRHADVEGANTLDLYRELLQLEVPERFGRGVVGKALATLRTQLAEGRGYGDLSDGAQKGWRAVVGHNRYDLEVMRSVCVSVADELALHYRRADSIPPALD